MTDLGTILAGLTLGGNAAGLGVTLARRRDWAALCWALLQIAVVALLLAGWIWHRHILIPDSGWLQWAIVAALSVLLGIGLWRFIRQDAARLRERRRRP